MFNGFINAIVGYEGVAGKPAEWAKARNHGEDEAQSREPGRERCGSFLTTPYSSKKHQMSYDKIKRQQRKRNPICDHDKH